MDLENITAKSRRRAKLGNYRSLPVPPEWFEFLWPCKIFKPRLKAPLAPDLWGPLNLDLVRYDSRLVEIFKLRFGLQDGRLWTLEEVGQRFGITRERVRQLEQKFLKRRLYSNADQNVFSVIDEGLLRLKERGVWVFRLAGGDQASWPYQYVAKLHRSMLISLPTGCWAMVKPSFINNPLSVYIRERRVYLPLEEASKIGGLNSYEIIHACSAMDGLFITQGGLVGSHKWTLLEWVEVIANELAKNGVYEWHFSQMAKLMSWLNPEGYGSITERNVAAALARNEAQFQNAGRNGVWRLKSLGDGFTDTKEAVLHILEKAKQPLHHTEIYSQLARPVRPETLTALLYRELEFNNLGEGYYCLAEQHYLLPQAPSYSSRAVAPLRGFDLPRISLHPRPPNLKFDGLFLDLTAVDYSLEAGQLMIGGEKAFSRPTNLNDASLENHLLFWLAEFDGIDLEACRENLASLCLQVIEHLRQIVPEDLVGLVMKQHSYVLAQLIYKQAQANNSQQTHFEIQVADGLEPLKLGLRRASGQPTDFKAAQPSDGWQEYMGFERCLYPVQVLDGASDLELVAHLERESVCWFRPVQGQFAIYKSDTSEEQFQPDFVAEFSKAYYMIDLIFTHATPNLIRQAALREWCRVASTRGVKPWRYTPLQAVDLPNEVRRLQ